MVQLTAGSHYRLLRYIKIISSNCARSCTVGQEKTQARLRAGLRNRKNTRCATIKLVLSVPCTRQQGFSMTQKKLLLGVAAVCLILVATAAAFNLSPGTWLSQATPEALPSGGPPVST